MEYIMNYSSPLGHITLSSDGEALTGLWFDTQRDPADFVSADYEENELSIFDDARRWLDDYFAGRDPGKAPAFRCSGTGFRMRVWEILQTIPYGTTMTYGEIASVIAEERGIGRMSAQAVGGAVGSNPISIIVPCHRVIGSDGSLTGYGGGLDLKRKLLEIEGIL